MIKIVEYKITTRNSVFETNSSSTHSFTYVQRDEKAAGFESNDITPTHTFGWSYGIFNSMKAKMDFVFFVWYNTGKKKDDWDIIEQVFKNITGQTPVYTEESLENFDHYMDHQNYERYVGYTQEDEQYDGIKCLLKTIFNNKHFKSDEDYVDRLTKFIKNPGWSIITGNDNC